MARLRKDVVKVGRYSVPDKDGKRHIVEFSHQDVAKMYANAKGMLSVSEVFAPPVCKEHQDNGKPRSKAQRLADKIDNHLGYGADVELSPDGSTLAYVIESNDEESAKKIEAIKWVSPEIQYDFEDGSGRVWDGPSITHIASTSRPVQWDQSPPQRLSLPSAKRVVRFSLADLEPEPMHNLKPAIAYLAKRGIKLPAGTPADKLLRRLHVVRLGLEDGEESEEKAEKATVAEVKDEAPEGIPADSGKTAMMKKAVEYLQGQGIHLPEDTTEDNFVERLCVACHALENSGAENDVETPNPNAQTGGAGQNTPQPAPTDGNMMMSLERDIKAMTARAEKAEAKLLKTEKDGLLRRIGGLRVSKPIRDKLAASLKTERLSLTTDGELAMSTLVAKIEAYEALDPESTNPVLMGLERGKGGEPQPVPDPDDKGEKPDQHVMDRLTGGRYRAANGSTK